MPKQPNTQLARRDVVRAILADRGEALVVGGLGSPAWDCAAVENNPLDFLLWGAMGNAASIGLGLAQAQTSRRVLVITGDGDMTMGLGSLAAIGSARPANLAIVVVDNEHYGETGMQPSHTGQYLDLAGIAKACGFTETLMVRDQAGLEAALPMIYKAAGPIAIIIKVKAENPPRVLPPRDGAFLKNRFRAALLGEERAQA